MVSARDVEVPETFLGELQLSAAPLLFQTCLFGMHTLLMFLSVYILWHAFSRQGFSATRRIVLLAFILVIYACSTIHWALAAAAFHDVVNDPVHVVGPSPVATIAGITVIGVNVTLSDAIVLWRAHVLWGRSRVLLLISLFLFMLTPTFLPVNIGILVKTTLSRQSLQQTAGDTVIGSLGVLSSCLTNIWATSLVVFKTAKCRRDFMKLLRDIGPGRSERVLMLLVESGVLYCVFWVALSAMAWAGLDDAQAEGKLTASLIAQSTIFAGMAQLCGIYPTLVIVAVCLQGVAYHPGILTGQLPGLDMQNGHISTELEFVRGTQATMRRSVPVSVGLPLPAFSSVPDFSEQDSHWHGEQQRDTDKKSVASMP